MEILSVLLIISSICFYCIYKSNHITWKDIPHAPIGWSRDKKKEEYYFMYKEIEYLISILPSELEKNKDCGGYLIMKIKFEEVIKEPNINVYRIYEILKNIFIWCNS